MEMGLNIFRTSTGHESQWGQNWKKITIENNVATSVATLPMGTDIYSFCRTLVIIVSCLNGMEPCADLIYSIMCEDKHGTACLGHIWVTVIPQWGYSSHLRGPRERMSLHLSLHHQGLQKRTKGRAKEEAQNLVANGTNGWTKLSHPIFFSY